MRWTLPVGARATYECLLRDYMLREGAVGQEWHFGEQECVVGKPMWRSGFTTNTGKFQRKCGRKPLFQHQPFYSHQLQ
jgi:hypothetical protein